MTNQEKLEAIANQFVGETVKGTDLIALVLAQYPGTNATSVFPAAADINTHAPSSASYRKFLKSVARGLYLVLPEEQRVNGVSTRASRTQAKGNSRIALDAVPEPARELTQAMALQTV